MRERRTLGEQKIPNATSQNPERNVVTSDRLSDLVVTGSFDAIPDDAATNEALAAPKMKDAVRVAIGTACREMNKERLVTIFKRCKPSDAEYGEALEDAFTGALDTDAHLGARMLMWAKDHPGAFTPKVLHAAHGALIRELEAGRTGVAVEILEALKTASSQQSKHDMRQFSIDAKMEEFFASASGRAALKIGLLNSLLASEPTERLVGFMQPSDVRSVKTDVAKTRMQASLDNSDVEELLKIWYESRDVVHRAGVERMLCRAVVKNIEDGYVERAQELATGPARDFLPRSFMESGEVFAAAAARIDTLLQEKDLSGATDIRNKLHVPNGRLMAPVKQAVVRELVTGNYEDALHILDAMDINSCHIVKIDDATKPALLRVLRARNREIIEQFNRTFEIPEEVLAEPDVQEAARKMLEENLGEIRSVQDVLSLVEQYKLQKVSATTETQTLAAELLAREIGSGSSYWIESVRAFADYFDLSQEYLRAAAQRGVRQLLAHDTYPQRAHDIVNDFGLPEREVQDVAIQTTTKLFQDCNIERAFGVMDAMNIPPEAISSTLDDVGQQTALQKMLQEDKSGLILRFVEVFHPSKEAILASPVHEAALVMVERIMQRRVNDAVAVAECFALRDEELKPIGYRALYGMLAEGKARWTFTLIKKLHLSKENAAEILGAHHPVLIFFDDAVPHPVRCAAETYAEGVTFVDQRSRLTHRVCPDEYRRIIEQNPTLREDANPEGIFDALLELPQESGEGAEISDAMQAFAEVVGKEMALRFANRPDLSRHDAFMCADELRKFIEMNKIAEEGQDRKNLRELLAQVAMDDKGYETGTANHEWNRVIRQLAHAPVETIIAEAEAAGIPGLQERVARLRTTRFHPLRSWRGLRDCAEIASLLERRELLEIFAAGTLPPKVQAFGEALLQHPTIDLEALTQLLLRPEEFLARTATYVDGDRQEKMSPANLVSQHRLLLSAEEVRDTLVDGRLDALQEIPPHEATFFFDQEGANIGTETYLRNAFLRAIGQQKRGIKGEAADPKALFRTLRQFGANIQRDMLAWLQSPSPTDTPLSFRQLGELRAILHSQIGVKPPLTHEVRVRVGRKDDAGVLAAMNDAASCMPFGDGKTNVYLWNPNCAFLVVERRTDEGWRTMAQSVIMKDMDIGRSAKEAIDRLKTATPMHDVLGAESLTMAPILTCDNIEPSASEISAGRMALIEQAYRAFFPDYLRTHAADMGVDPTRIVIGKETYDTRRPAWGFETVVNTFLPAAPISYSDNSGTDSYILRTDIASPEGVAGAKGVVAPIRASDVLALAYAEGKSFDNAAMIVGLYKIQHRIVGQALSREIHGDPNLSFISRNKEGQPAGYILAGLDRSQERPEVYIADFATDRSLGVASARHAIKILDTFLETYMAHWQDAEIIPDIFAEMREKTSYRLLQRQGEKIAKKFGFAISINEEGTSTKGDETMHHVRVSIDRL